MERLGVPAALHPADLGLLTDQQSQPLSAQGPAGRLLLSLSRHSFQTQAFLPFTPTVELREGDSLAPWGVDARVLELPGHTAGSIGLDVEGHSLIVGDAMMNLFRPGPSCLCSDPAAQRDSIARIRSLGPQIPLFRPWPSSSPPWIRKPPFREYRSLPRAARTLRGFFYKLKVPVQKMHRTFPSYIRRSK